MVSAAVSGTFFFFGSVIVNTPDPFLPVTVLVSFTSSDSSTSSVCFFSDSAGCWAVSCGCVSDWGACVSGAGASVGGCVSGAGASVGGVVSGCGASVGVCVSGAGASSALATTASVPSSAYTIADL